MLSKLNGYKTYVIAACGVIYAITGLVTGNVDANQAMTVIWAALALAGLRHGISTQA